MSELAYRLMLVSKGWGSPKPGMTPKLGDLVRFSDPVFGRADGCVIMTIAEAGRPTRYEILLRHGNPRRETYHWRRAEQLSLVATANPNQRFSRYDVRHQDPEEASETS